MITKDLRILSDFCKGCGTCEAICPQGAIRLERMEESGRYFPRIEGKLCNKCSICCNSCPAWPFDPNGASFRFLKPVLIDHLIGSFLNTYSGFADDNDIRKFSSSGGIATSILIQKLKSRDIDTALVVCLSEKNPFEPKVLLAKSADGIRKASGSKYLPVPLNSALKEIMAREDIRRVGIVGLPCHVEGIRKACKILKGLERKIAFMIGLFCKQTKELGYTKLLLSRLGIKDLEVDSFSYRGSGWPGYVRARLKKGKDFQRSLTDEGFVFLWSAHAFSPLSCVLCCDPTAEFADVSIGDAWLEEFANERDGMSLIVTRTHIGDMLIRDAESKNVISIKPISPEDVVRSQSRRALMIRKINYRTKLISLKPLGYKQISKNFRQHLDLMGILVLKQIIIIRAISSSRLFCSFFNKLPPTFFKLLKRILLI